MASPNVLPAKPYLLFKTAESNNYLRQFTSQDPWIESLSVSLCSSRPLARPPARPSFLGDKSTSHITFWAKPKANAHLSNGFVKFLHFNLYLVMCHKTIMTDTSVQGITDLFRTLGKSIKRQSPLSGPRFGLPGVSANCWRTRQAVHFLVQKMDPKLGPWSGWFRWRCFD